MHTIRIGLIGDHDPAVTAHQAIPPALGLAAASLSDADVEPVWLPTNAIDPTNLSSLSGFDGLWCVPASPYASTEGALAAIGYAREKGIPFLGTCGGFQHALIEYAKNVAGIIDAEHAETAPDAEVLLVSRLSCSLVEERGEILLQEGSAARQIYARDRTVEGYHCSFGLNPAYERALQEAGLCFTGRDEAGEVRVLELPGHPFFMATLFQPERSSLRGETHPLVRAFVQAAFELVRSLPPVPPRAG
jgi:CTP synthase (UTP-ammonia lyase)